LNGQVLYVATGNEGKLRDFATAADTCSPSSPWKIAALPGLGDIAAPEETADTFYQNACAKALYYGQYALESIVIADDSGLVVDALGGAPGVYSARFAERAGFEGKPSQTPDERNNACLLTQLRPFERSEERAAQYVCVLAAVRDGRVIATSEGAVAGEILTRERGDSGFGYDPLFFLPRLNKTMAELDAATRLKLSHRGAALRQLLPQLAHFVVEG
jgi:XTP/dITP diphosphohydrolase